MRKLKPYRLGAIAYVINEAQQILLVQHNSYGENEWSLPGGGLQANETPEQNAKRELIEEVSIYPKQLELVGISKKQLKYDFPKEMVQNSDRIALKFRGQQKYQVVFKYYGANDLVIDRNELKAYKWCAIADLKKYLLFPNQYQKTIDVINEFKL